jgi:hypothetical protein
MRIRNVEELSEKAKTALDKYLLYNPHIDFSGMPPFSFFYTGRNSKPFETFQTCSVCRKRVKRHSTPFRIVGHRGDNLRVLEVKTRSLTTGKPVQERG